MKLRLQSEAKLATIPDRVCSGCQAQLASLLAKGSTVRSEQRVKDQNRLMLWRNRVGLVKKAKAQLSSKSYAEAAVSYEKYLRVLELVYDKKPGELTPELFRNQAGAQELTVITSVYWDLMRIYDTNSQYSSRQLKAAEKLASFVKYTPIFPQLMRKAEGQIKTAKNPEAFKKFVKLANSNRPRCFIATAAYDGQRTETVDTLCRFRDEFLKSQPVGRSLVYRYYAISPTIAEFLDTHPALKPATRKLLTWLAESKFIRNRLNP